MKKILFATTALVLSAGIASADVKLSGYGRFGLTYDDSAVAPAKSTQVSARLRFNIDASTETDGGLAFGARVRMQWDQGSGSRGTAAALNAAVLYVKYGPLKVEVGNAGGAYDSAAVLYGGEVGFQSRSYGDPSGTFFAYTTGPYSGKDRLGIRAIYTMGDFEGQLSYITPNQTGAVAVEEEIALAVKYSFGDLTLSAAYAQSGGGVKGNDLAFVGAEYMLASYDATVGFKYIDNGGGGTSGLDDEGKTITLYGSKAFGPYTVGLYVASNDAPANDTDIAYGIGASYDLGGATLSAAIESGYGDTVLGIAPEMRADIGIKFDF